MRISFKMLFLLVACVGWVPPYYMPNWVTFIFRALTFAYLLKGFRLKKAMKDPLFGLILAYTVMQIVSELMNYTNIQNFLTSVGFFLVLPSIYLVGHAPKFGKYYLQAITIVITLYFLLDAIFVFFTSGLGVNVNNQPLYFSGGKFQACYVYLIMMMLFLLERNVHIAVKTALMLFGVILAAKVDCMTGMLAIVFFGMTQYIPGKFYSKKKIYIWLTALLVVNYMIVFVQVQTANPTFRMIITSILHRDMNLTGRIRIYNNFTDIMREHWWFGYGYCSDYIAEYTGRGGLDIIANTQNGFLQTIYTSGLIGLILFMLILFQMFKRFLMVDDNGKKIVLLGAITSFLIVAIVEIPFSSSIFYLVLGAILVCASGTKTQRGITDPENPRLRYKSRYGIEGM